MKVKVSRSTKYGQYRNRFCNCCRLCGQTSAGRLRNIWQTAGKTSGKTLGKTSGNILGKTAKKHLENSNLARNNQISKKFLVQLILVVKSKPPSILILNIPQKSTQFYDMFSQNSQHLSRARKVNFLGQLELICWNTSSKMSVETHLETYLWKHTCVAQKVFKYCQNVFAFRFIYNLHIIGILMLPHIVRSEGHYYPPTRNTHDICQIFYTSTFSKFWKFTPKKRLNITEV